MEKNVRNPDQSFNDVLINSNMNTEENLDDDIQKAISESLNQYNNDFERQCQENVIETQIQELLQKEYDEKKSMREYRQSLLQPLTIRLLRIDPNKEYTNIISKYIETGNPILQEEHNNLKTFIGKPSLIQIIDECVIHQ